MGDASPELLEAVIAEVVGALGGGAASTQRRHARAGRGRPGHRLLRDVHRAGAPRTRTARSSPPPGATARASSPGSPRVIAELGGDILDISQTLVGDYFTMILVVDIAQPDVRLRRLQGAPSRRRSSRWASQCMMMHEDVVTRCTAYDALARATEHPRNAAR